MNWFRNIFAVIYDILLGCHHAHLTRPFTLEEQTYKVCLDCGKQVYYSLDTMRPLRGRELRQMRAAAGARSGATVIPVTAVAPSHIASHVPNSSAAA